MPRRCHFIKPNDRTEQPSHMIFFDTETRQDVIDEKTKVHVLNFGKACYVRRRDDDTWFKPLWHDFADNKSFYNFVEESTAEKRKLYVFCHNTNFDLPVTDVMGNMKLLGYNLVSAIIMGPPTILKFKRGRRTVVFLDTLNFFRMSLKELGNFIGLEKYEPTDKDGNLVFDAARCERDVEIICKAMQDWLYFLKSNDLGGFAPTLAGQSMRAYRHRFMDFPVLIDANDAALDTSRNAYFGGRTEAFRLGKIAGPLYLVDVNSMYPSVMKGHDYPAILRTVWTSATHAEVSRALENSCLCAEVVINTDEPVYPLRMNNRLTFPTGQFTTFLSTPEIKYGLDHGHIISFRKVAVYKPARIFDAFVDYFYTKRKEAKAQGDAVGSTMHKLILNSCYGKFGQKGAPWIDDGQIDDLSSGGWVEKNMETGELFVYRKMAGLRQVQGTETESRESHPAIAAHVTAYARMKLWTLMKKAGRENVYYVDTDSLLVNHRGIVAIGTKIDPDRLGFLSCDAKFKDAEIFGAKDYRFGERVKIKGIKKTAKQTVQGTYQQEQWSSLRGLLRGGSMTAPTTKTVTKTLKREYKKGNVSKRGKITPYRLTDPDRKQEKTVKAARAG